MNDYESVLAAALQLSEDERQLLIDELWEETAPIPGTPFSDDWAQEIKRRLVEIKTGTVETIPWSEVLAKAEARSSPGQTH